MFYVYIRICLESITSLWQIRSRYEIRALSTPRRRRPVPRGAQTIIRVTLSVYGMLE